MEIKSGEINPETEKDYNKLFQFMKEAVAKDTLNDKMKDFLLKGLNRLEVEIKDKIESDNRIEWLIDNLSGVKLKEYAKIRRFN